MPGTPSMKVLPRTDAYPTDNVMGEEHVLLTNIAKEFQGHLRTQTTTTTKR